ncbi:FLOT1 protein, partial [Dicrurus megarhynchus]|nr:FLOT1 protein [Dicrurus megarhynchus]
QEIYKDRQKFSDQVFRVASSDLVNMGISVVSYTLKDVHDEQVAPGTPGGDSWGAWGHTWGHWGQLGTLGTARGAGDSWGHTWRHLGQLGGHGGQQGQLGTLRTHLWGQLGTAGGTQGQLRGPGGTRDIPGAARSQQAIAAQRGEVALVERAQRAQLQEQEVGRRRQELEATVRKPAEAERYRLEQLAEAQR